MHQFWPHLAAAHHRGHFSSVIGVADFQEVHAAAEFAYAWELYLDTSVTIAWRLLGVEACDVQSAFTAFLKCLRAWCADHHIEPAWIYCHEVAPSIGLHTHVAVFVPGPIAEDHRNFRPAFRAWANGWAPRHAGARTPYAVRVRCPRTTTPWLHWLNVNYQLKGYDQDAVVVSAHNAPDGQDLTLGDLIAFEWRDPGYVPLARRIQASHSLGPDVRATGAPDGLCHLRPPAKGYDFGGLFGPSTLKPPKLEILSGRRPQRPLAPFRSTFEDGARDVRLLYPPEFWSRVNRA